MGTAGVARWVRFSWLMLMISPEAGSRDGGSPLARAGVEMAGRERPARWLVEPPGTPAATREWARAARDTRPGGSIRRHAAGIARRDPIAIGVARAGQAAKVDDDRQEQPQPVPADEPGRRPEQDVHEGRERQEHDP